MCNLPGLKNRTCDVRDKQFYLQSPVAALDNTDKEPLNTGTHYSAHDSTPKSLESAGLELAEAFKSMLLFVFFHCSSVVSR